MDRRAEDQPWLTKRRVYFKWMTILAVIALPLNIFVEVYDRHLIKLQLPEPFATVLSHLATGSASILLGWCAMVWVIYMRERRMK